MQTAAIVAGQVVVMFLLIAVGLAACKTKIVSIEATRSFSNLLLCIVMPGLLINSCIRPMKTEQLMGLGLAFLLAAAFHLAAIAVANLMIPKREDERYLIERIAAIYSNCGFMAFPLLEASIGEEAVFYAIPFVAVFNICNWTHGVTSLTKGGKCSVRKIFLNPGVIGAAIGLLLYFTQLPLPGVVTDTLGHIAAANTPLAMMITGIFLSEVTFKDLLSDWRAYHASIVRTVVLPLAFLAVLFLLRVPSWFAGADIVCYTILLCASCPAAAATIFLTARARWTELMLQNWWRFPRCFRW